MTTAYFLGDSLVAIALADELCSRMGWTYVPRAPQNEPPGGTIDGVGGSAYLNAGSGTVFGDATRMGYVLAAAPDVVVIIGGGNDNSLDDAEVIAAAQAFWTTLRAGLPGARLVGTGLHRPCDEPKASGIEDACTLAGGLWIDGAAWTPETSDGVHPTAAGNVYCAALMAYALGVNRVAGITLESGVPLMLEVPA